MKLSKILVPVDFSDFDSRAVALATSLAKGSGAELLIVHVEEAPAAYGEGGLYFGVPEPSNESLRERLHDIQPTDSSIRCEHRFLDGQPSEMIVRTAAEEKIDLIVMSTHGRTGLRRLLMGSVAESVVRGAPCPVLTYRPNAESDAQGDRSD